MTHTQSKTISKRRGPAHAAPVAAMLGAALAIGMQAASPMQSFAAEQAAVAAPAREAASVTSKAPEQSQFHVGDRVQINFFEHMELSQPAGPDAGSTGPMRTFYQRLDLTGEYRVELDGTLAIPLLGRFDIGGKTMEQLRTEIATAFERETGRDGEVHLAILAHQPVFVMGVVRTPGSYAFTPGMFALQAIALAGGYERLPEGAPQHLEARRERERLAQATRRLQRLVAQRAGILEKRDGKEVAAQHPLLTAGSQELARLMAGERELVEVENAVRDDETQIQQAALDGALGELEALRGSLDLVERQIEARAERLQLLQQMRGRGVTNLEAVWGAQKEVTDYEVQREQITSAIYAAEQKVAQAKLAKSKVELGSRADLAKQLVAVEDEIAALEATIATSEDIARRLEAMAGSRGVGPEDAVEITILRHSGDGVVELAAEEATELMPNDVVKIGLSKDRSLHTAGTSLR